MRFLMTFGPLKAAAGTDIEGPSYAVGPQPVRVLSVHLSPSDAVTADASNFVTFSLVNGSTTLASWSTQTSAQGALTADTPVDLTVTRSAAVVPAGGQLKAIVVNTASGQAVEAGLTAWCELMN
jgi:hypothetical protein